MPQRVLGIDLGAWAVKVAEIELGFRTMRSIGVQSARVAPDAPWPRGALDALRGLRELRGLAADLVFVALPGDRVLVHALELPFAEPKKIDAVVGFELEPLIPWEIDEVVCDYAIARLSPEGAPRGAVALVAAARREEVRALLEPLAALGLDPRSVVPAPFAYAGPTRRGVPADRSDECVAWIDVGHRLTNVCVVGPGVPGTPRFVRTLSHGGADVTEALQRALGVPLSDAEVLKHSGAHDARTSRPVRAALEPLLRDLRVSFEAYRALAAADAEGPPVRAILCGGGARLAGLAEEIAAALEIPTEIAGSAASAREAGRADESGAPDFAVPPPLAERPVGRADAAAAPEASLALALALRAVDKRRLPDFRRGDLAYRGDVSFLRGKVRHIGACAIIVLGSALLAGFASLSVMTRERARLERRLRVESKALFGQELVDGEEVSRRLRGQGKQSGPPIPEATAFDVLRDLSLRTPPATEVRLELLELDVKPKKTYVKATTASAAAVDALVAAWKASDCVSEIHKGRVADTAGGAEKQFTLTVETKCF